MANKKVGVIGSGQVAQTLSAGFIKHGYEKHGYEVMAGSRDITKLNEWKAKAGLDSRVGNTEEVAAFGDIIVLAVKEPEPNR